MTSAQEELVRFQIDAASQIANWESQILNSSGDAFFDVEQSVDNYFRIGAGKIVAALLDTTSKSEQVADEVTKIQNNADTSLRNPTKVSLVIRLLCGLIIEISTLYSAPARDAKPDTTTAKREGLYPELAAYGFGKGVTAALENRIVRAAALYPSFAVAQKELTRDGLELDTKMIRRVSLQCGETLLAIRREKVELFLSGNMPVGDALTGKRVVVEEDGGRMRHREKITIAPEQKKPGQHPKFNAPWREPKLFIIYCVDEKGKKEKDSEVWMNATFQGADHAAEMLAATLHELGAIHAICVTFLADGANCLWDRFDWVVEAVGLDKDRVDFVLDFFHASHHISLALKELGLDDATRQMLYRELRSELRQSRWADVVSMLEESGQDLLLAFEEEKKNKETKKDDETKKEKEAKTPAAIFARELNYLRKHGEAGHLCYVNFTARGLPLGSGAVESAIRRVINLRLKSNGTFWVPENAEMMLQLRCQILSTQWEKCGVDLRSYRRRTRSRRWRWEASDRSRSGRNQNSDTSPKPTKCRDSSIQAP